MIYRRISYGFTLIELLVAISIMAVLSTIVIANFRAGNKSKSVLLATDIVSSAIRTAQDTSLNPKEVPTILCATSKVPKFYILKLDSVASTVELWAEDQCSNPDILLQKYMLPQGSRIIQTSGLKIDITDVGAGGGNIRLRFATPFAQVTGSVNGSLPYKSFGNTVILLQSNDGTVTKKVILDGNSGRVDIQ